MKNTIEEYNEGGAKEADFKFKAIVFQCETEEEQDAIIDKTEFKIAGKYLIQRKNKT